MVTIGNLPLNKIDEDRAGSAVYERLGGALFFRINEHQHMPAKREGNQWVGHGMVEDINPDEEVRVVHLNRQT